MGGRWGVGMWRVGGSSGLGLCRCPCLGGWSGETRGVWRRRWSRLSSRGIGRISGFRRGLMGSGSLTIDGGVWQVIKCEVSETGAGDEGWRGIGFRPTAGSLSTTFLSPLVPMISRTRSECLYSKYVTGKPHSDQFEDRCTGQVQRHTPSVSH